MRWIGLALVISSSVMMAVAAWPVPRYNDSNVDYPRQLRIGDTDTLAVRIHPQVTQGQVIAVARVNAVGVRLDPAGDVLQSVTPGQVTLWRWHIAAGDEPGRRQVNVVVYLRHIPERDGELTDQPIWARSLAVTVIDVFGMPASTARIVALIGTAAGFSLTLIPLARPRLFRRKP